MISQKCLLCHTSYKVAVMFVELANLVALDCYCRSTAIAVGWSVNGE